MNIMISVGTVAAFPQIAAVQLFCDFLDCIILSGLYLLLDIEPSLTAALN